MTRKEQLYEEWMNINEQIEELNPNFIAAERAMPRAEVMRCPVNVWQRRIEEAKRSLQISVRAKRVNDYWATDGQARKKALLDEVRRLYNEISEDWYCAAESATREMIQDLIGKDFDTRFSGSKIEVGLVEKYVGDLPCFYFAHSWDLYFGYDYVLKEFKFEMGHGSCGSFNLVEDTNYTKFIAGMAKFATSTEFLAKLKEELQYFDEEVRNRQKRIRAIEEELKNPFNNK